jgi:hypothetical protein
MKEIYKIVVGILATIGGAVCIVVIGLAISFYVDSHWGNNSLDNKLAIADCGWNTTASAWIDENKNGIWDTNEKPLAGVRFIADNVNYNDYLPEDSLSDKDGKAGLLVFPLVCDMNNEKIIVYAVPPNDYKPTTVWRIIVPKEKVINNKNNDFKFGFVSKDK